MEVIDGDASGLSTTSLDRLTENWAVEAGREALLADADWSLILSRLVALAAVAIVCAWMATGAFRSYQRSV